MALLLTNVSNGMDSRIRACSSPPPTHPLTHSLPPAFTTVTDIRSERVVDGFTWVTFCTTADAVCVLDDWYRTFLTGLLRSSPGSIPPPTFCHAAALPAFSCHAYCLRRRGCRVPFPITAARWLHLPATTYPVYTPTVHRSWDVSLRTGGNQFPTTYPTPRTYLMGWCQHDALLVVNRLDRHHRHAVDSLLVIHDPHTTVPPRPYHSRHDHRHHRIHRHPYTFCRYGACAYALTGRSCLINLRRDVRYLLGAREFKTHTCSIADPSLIWNLFIVHRCDPYYLAIWGDLPHNIVWPLTCFLSAFMASYRSIPPPSYPSRRVDLPIPSPYPRQPAYPFLFFTPTPNVPVRCIDAGAYYARIGVRDP